MNLLDTPHKIQLKDGWMIYSVLMLHLKLMNYQMDFLTLISAIYTMWIGTLSFHFTPLVRSSWINLCRYLFPHTIRILLMICCYYLMPQLTRYLSFWVQFRTALQMRLKSLIFFVQFRFALKENSASSPLLITWKEV